MHVTPATAAKAIAGSQRRENIAWEKYDRMKAQQADLQKRLEMYESHNPLLRLLVDADALDARPREGGMS